MASNNSNHLEVDNLPKTVELPNKTNPVVIPSAPPASTMSWSTAVARSEGKIVTGYRSQCAYEGHIHQIIWREVNVFGVDIFRHRSSHPIIAEENIKIEVLSDKDEMKHVGAESRKRKTESQEVLTREVKKAMEPEHGANSNNEEVGIDLVLNNVFELFGKAVLENVKPLSIEFLRKMSVKLQSFVSLEEQADYFKKFWRPVGRTSQNTANQASATEAPISQDLEVLEIKEFLEPMSLTDQGLWMFNSCYRIIHNICQRPMENRIGHFVLNMLSEKDKNILKTHPDLWITFGDELTNFWSCRERIVKLRNSEPSECSAHTHQVFDDQTSDRLDHLYKFQYAHWNLLYKQLWDEIRDYGPQIFQCENIDVTGEIQEEMYDDVVVIEPQGNARQNVEPKSSNNGKCKCSYNGKQGTFSSSGEDFHRNPLLKCLWKLFAEAALKERSCNHLSLSIQFWRKVCTQYLTFVDSEVEVDYFKSLGYTNGEVPSNFDLSGDIEKFGFYDFEPISRDKEINMVRKIFEKMNTEELGFWMFIACFRLVHNIGQYPIETFLGKFVLKQLSEVDKHVLKTDPSLWRFFYAGLNSPFMELWNTRQNEPEEVETSDEDESSGDEDEAVSDEDPGDSDGDQSDNYAGEETDISDQEESVTEMNSSPRSMQRPTVVHFSPSVATAQTQLIVDIFHSYGRIMFGHQYQYDRWNQAFQNVLNREVQLRRGNISQNPSSSNATNTDDDEPRLKVPKLEPETH